MEQVASCSHCIQVLPSPALLPHTENMWQKDVEITVL